MKCFLKFCVLIIVSMLVALVVYPLAHELSHSIVAIIMGAQVIKVSIFPLPYTVCDVSRIGQVKSVFIALSGTLLPFFVSLVNKPKNFWVWYANFIVKVINVLALLLGVVSVVLFNFGNSMRNDDFTKILYLMPNARWCILVFIIFLVSIQIALFAKEKPLKKCVGYFL